MTFMALQGAIEQGLIYGLVSLGLYISYKILDVADLTTDGSFTLGAATSAIFTVAGHPFLGIIFAMILGSLAGYVTAFLQTKMKVQPILAGIITMTALYSINLMVMGGKSNVALMKKTTIFTPLVSLFGKNIGNFTTIFIVILTVCIAVILFMKTNLGLSIRATGDNIDMVCSSSINPHLTTIIGLMLANAIIALSGGLFSQHQQFSDISLGTGMVVIGLASLIIGEVLIGKGTVTRCVIGVIVGSIIYRIIITLALSSSISTSNLKLVSALIVAVAISYPTIKEKILLEKTKRESLKNATNK